MKEINFLPEWYINKIEFIKLIKITAVVMAVIFIFSAAAAYLLNYMVMTAESELHTLIIKINNEDYDYSDKIYFELIEMEQLIESYEKNIDVLNQVIITDYLKIIIASMPEGIYAESINYSSDNHEFIINGFTTQADDIPLFINSLGANFNDVSLTRLNNSGNRIYFSLKFLLKFSLLMDDD